MSEDSFIVLDELNKGCSMGKESLSIILDKCNDGRFKDLIFSLLNEYNTLSIDINKLHDMKTEKEIKDTSTISKVMTWYGINIRTITDSSDSKLSELTMQGLNMGIIEGRKFLNTGKLDKKVVKLLKRYVDMQEEYVEKIKNYL